MTKIPPWWGVLGMTILEEGGLDICPWDPDIVRVQDELVNKIKIYGEELEKANIIE